MGPDVRSPVRSAVRDEVLARLDEVAARVVRAIAEQIPAYAALSRDQLVEVTAIAEWGTRRVLDLWIEDGELSAADVARFRGIGAARALDGRPLPGVLRAYRLAGTEIADLVEELGADRLTVADALALTRLWMSTVDTLSEALYAGHSAAAERVGSDRARALGDLVDDLLLGRQVTRTGLADRSRELGIGLGPRVGLLVLTSPDEGSRVTPEALDALLGGPERPPDVLTRVRGSLAIVVLPAALSVDAAEVERRGWRGCLVGAVRIVDLPRTFRLAERALGLAPDRAFAVRRVLDEADAQVLALLSGDADADPERLDALLLEPLRAGGGHLLEGLQAYVATGSATEAADLLHVHPQTMRYRTRRLVEITGRDPRTTWDRFVLETAVLSAASRRVVRE